MRLYQLQVVSANQKKQILHTFSAMSILFFLAKPTLAQRKFKLNFTRSSSPNVKHSLKQLGLFTPPQFYMPGGSQERCQNEHLTNTKVTTYNTETLRSLFRSQHEQGAISKLQVCSGFTFTSLSRVHFNTIKYSLNANSPAYLQEAVELLIEFEAAKMLHVPFKCWGLYILSVDICIYTYINSPK